VKVKLKNVIRQEDTYFWKSPAVILSHIEKVFKYLSFKFKMKRTSNDFILI